MQPGTLLPPVVFGLRENKTPIRMTQKHKAMNGNMLTAKLYSLMFSAKELHLSLGDAGRLKHSKENPKFIVDCVNAEKVCIVYSMHIHTSFLHWAKNKI